MPKIATSLSNYLVFDKLKDGRNVLVRAIEPHDKCFLQEGMHHLSKQSIYFRFFIFKDSLSDKELDYFTKVDFVNHVALIAGFYVDSQFKPVGTGRYIVSTKPGEAGSAEMAITVVEEYQRLGFATVLLRHLVKIARAGGLKELIAYVLPENIKMLNLLNQSGLPLKRTFDRAGEWDIRLNLSGVIEPYSALPPPKD